MPQGNTCNMFLLFNFLAHLKHRCVSHLASLPDGTIIFPFSKPEGDAIDGSGGVDMGLPGIDSDNYITVSNVNWRQGRQLLRQ